MHSPSKLEINRSEANFKSLRHFTFFFLNEEGETSWPNDSSQILKRQSLTSEVTPSDYIM